MSQSDIFYSINNIQFRAVYDDQTRAFTPYTKIDGGTFTLNVSDLQIGAIEIKDGTTDDRAHVTPGGLLAVDASGAVVPISATALPLPSGAATSANQASIISAIGNTNSALGLQAKLTDTQPVSISGTVAVTGAFFQATQPVSLASLPNSNVTVLNSSLPVTGTFWQGTQPISGAISFTAPQHVIVDSAPTTAVTIASLPVGHNIIDSGSVSITGTVATSLASTTITGSVAVTGTFWQGTQPVSLASLPSLAAGSAVIGHVVVDSGSITIANASIAVTGTFWQATQPVSGTFWQATQPVSLASTTITGSVAVTGSFWQATQPISAAALPLPTGASTEATLATLATQATLAAVKARTDNIPVQGQAESLVSLPVVFASDQNTNADRQARRIQEMQLIEAADMGAFVLAKRNTERISVTDRRGSIGRGATR
jgi:hypothetical protein